MIRTKRYIILQTIRILPIIVSLINTFLGNPNLELNFYCWIFYGFSWSLPDFLGITKEVIVKDAKRGSYD